MQNTQGITSTTFWHEAHCFCPLGKQHYSAMLRCEAMGFSEYPEFIELQNELKGLDGRTLTVEELVDYVYRVVSSSFAGGKARVRAEVPQGAHFAVTVEKGGFDED